MVELDEYVDLHDASTAVHVSLKHRDCSSSEAATAVPFNGLARDLRVRSSLCEQGLQYRPHELRERFPNAGALVFGDAFDQLAMQQALQLRPWVRFERGVYEAAAAFVARAFGGRPFLAIHWRRTDFLMVRASQCVLQPAQALIATRAR